MNSHPIPFTSPMVRAILDGSKTQTRRVVKGSQAWPINTHHVTMLESRGTAMAVDAQRRTYGPEIKCPYGMPGDQLWVREAWRVIDVANCFAPREITAAHRIWYEADAPHQPGFGKYRPPMFMPRWASRITLEITGVRVEKLQDISEADAQAEGVERIASGGFYRYSLPGDSPGLMEVGKAGKCPTAFAKLAYEALWESINGPGSWAANPWVWVIEFKRVKP